MKPYYVIFIFLIVLTGCTEGDAVFHLQSKNFGKNAVLNIVDPRSNESLAVENLVNETQEFKISLPRQQYALLKISDESGTTSYLMYLKKGRYEVVADRLALRDYPIKESSVAQVQEFIDYYKIKDQTTKSIEQDFERSKVEFDNSTPENVLEKSHAMSDWAAKKTNSDLEAIKVVAEKYPESENTLFILDQLGLVESHALAYAAIFDKLDPDVQHSKAGKSLLKEITVSRQMMEGSVIPAIAGENPKGEAFEASKVLKKANVIICWATYDKKSREQNPVLVSLYHKYRGQDVEFIGISIDKNKNWWTDVISTDHLIWPQYTDLQGAKSPNAKAFSNLRIPYILLTDQKGKIIRSDISLDRLEATLRDYLESNTGT